MKPDIPIIGQPSPTSEAFDLLRRVLNETRPLLPAPDPDLEFEALWKIAALRKSAGITDQARTTINVRRPPRYLKGADDL